MNKTYISFSEIDITPGRSYELIGFNRDDNWSRGVLHRLLAQALLIKHTQSLFCIVAIDSIGFSINDSNAVRKGIADILGIDTANIMLCFSHTHAAPENGYRTKSSTEYHSTIIEKIYECIKNANKDFVECKAAWGVAKAKIGENRRNSIGLVDDRVGVLKLTDAVTDEPILLLLRATAHGNVLMADNYLVSSDYFGVTRSRLEDRYGCKVMMTQGSPGNIRPAYQGSVKDLSLMADEIESALSSCEDTLLPQQIYDVKMLSIHHTFYTDNLPTGKEAIKIAQRAKCECGIDGAGWLKHLEELTSAHIERQASEVEMQFFKLNDGCLCGMPLEPFCEIALDASRAAGNELLFFGGYTNGCDGYFPTKEEYYRGGYDVLYSYLIYYIYFNRVMPFAPETADEVVELVKLNWQAMNR